MQIILIQDVQHLGSLGDEVHVKDGFARNYLLPRGMAIMAGSKKIREVEHHRKRLDQLRQKAIENAKSESEKVAELKLVVQAKAGANGRLFGSVTNRDIQAVLEEQGYTLDRRSIQLQTPIKSLGNFTVTVRLHTDVKVDVDVRVEADTVSESTAPEEGAEGAETAEAAQGGEAAGESAGEAMEAAEAAGESAGEATEAAEAAEAAAGDGPAEEASQPAETQQAGAAQPAEEADQKAADGASEDETVAATEAASGPASEEDGAGEAESAQENTATPEN